MLAGIYYGAMYGGSTTSILVNIPGEAATVVTCLDGYQMALQGRAGAALGIAAFGSFIAGTLGISRIDVFCAPPLAKFALRIWSAGIFWPYGPGPDLADLPRPRFAPSKRCMMGALGIIPVSHRIRSWTHATPWRRFTWLSVLWDGIDMVPWPWGYSASLKSSLMSKKAALRNSVKQKSGTFCPACRIGAQAKGLFSGVPFLDSSWESCPAEGRSFLPLSPIPLRKGYRRNRRNSEKEPSKALPDRNRQIMPQRRGLCSSLHAWNPVQHRHGPALRSPCHSWGYARPLSHERSSRSLLGGDQQHVHGKCDALSPEPASHPPLGPSSEDSLRILFPLILLFCIIGAFSSKSNTVRRPPHVYFWNRRLSI